MELHLKYSSLRQKDRAYLVPVKTIVFTLCMEPDLVHLPHIKVFHNSILLSPSLANEKK